MQQPVAVRFSVPDSGNNASNQNMNLNLNSSPSSSSQSNWAAYEKQSAFDHEYLHQLYQRERDVQTSSLFESINGNSKSLQQQQDPNRFLLQCLMSDEELGSQLTFDNPSNPLHVNSFQAINHPNNNHNHNLNHNSNMNAHQPVSFSNYFPSICPPSPPTLSSDPPMHQQHPRPPSASQISRQRSLSSPINFTPQGMSIHGRNTPDGYRYSGPSPAPMAMPGSPDPTAHPHYNHLLPSIANLVNANGRRSISPLPVQFTVVPTYAPQAVYAHQLQQPQFQNVISPSLIQCLQTNQTVVYENNPNDLFMSNNMYKEDLFNSPPEIAAPPVPIARPVAYRPTSNGTASVTNSNSTVEGKIEEILFLDKLQPRMNRRWGKLLRQSLKTEPAGKVYFTDTIKKKNFFQFNFNGKGENLPSDENIIRKIFNNADEIEALFVAGDKPVTTKTYSLEYGRKVIHSRIHLPLFVTFNTDTKVITFESEYRSYSQEKVHPKRLAKEENERIRNYNLARTAHNQGNDDNSGEEENVSDEKIKKRKVEA